MIDLAMASPVICVTCSRPAALAPNAEERDSHQPRRERDRALRSVSQTATLAALTDGEDFELLFSVASKGRRAVARCWKKQFPKLR